MKFIYRLIRWTITFLLSVACSLFVLEIAYRYQWFDFYSAELKGLNTARDLHPVKGRKSILIGGDSFTSLPGNYVDSIRKYFPGYAVINSSVPGTGILQASYILPGRIKKYQPSVFIYQVYVGNDLSDIRHVTDNKTGFARKMYWKLSDRLHILSYINYKLGGVKADVSGSKMYRPVEDDTFSVAQYNSREKILFASDPSLVDHTLSLTGGRNDDYTILNENLHGIISQLPQNCKVILLIIPYAAQVSEKYFHNMETVGAIFSRDVSAENNFPFYSQLKKDFPSAMIIDPLYAFRIEEAKGNRMYFANDPHLSAEGQAALGTIVKEVLKKNAGE